MAVVFHPGKAREDHLRRAVDAERAAAGWDEVRWYPTTPEDHGAGVARRAIGEGAETVAAAGGDGTVRAVAGALRGSGVPIALVPQGTGNLLARNLGLPLGLEAAVRLAFGEASRAIDVGVVDATMPDGSVVRDEPFLVMAGMGIDATMVRATRPVLKRTIGWMAYADAVWRTLPKSAPFRVRYAVDGAPPRTTRVHSMVVANCDTLPGGLRVVPDSRPDDGVLDMAGFRPRGVLGVVRVWVTVAIENGVLRRFAWGRAISDRRSARGRDMIFRSGTHIALRAEQAVGVQVDGDDLGDAIALDARIEPGALLVKVPV